jgi:hypothetical protein
MKHTLWISLLGAALFALGYASLPAPAAQAADAACGGKGQPSCPLQGWMEKNMDPAVEKADMKAIAAGYEKISKMSPDPAWNTATPSWSKIALAGKAAAEKGDMAAVKAECKTCHKAFRDKYKTAFRTKPVPN